MVKRMKTRIKRSVNVEKGEEWNEEGRSGKVML